MAKDILQELVGKQVKRQTQKAVGANEKSWHEVVVPYELQDKFQGVSIGYDKRPKTKGYFIYTHRARSEKTYSSIARIPESIIKKIEATG